MTKRAAILLLIAAVASGAAEPHMPLPVRAVFEKYCFDCHDDATSKAKFSLESLKPQFVTEELARRWTRVHDRIAACEMPPARKPQPASEERQAITDWLRTGLHNASFARQQNEGRVMIRRLNRTEYEYTLRDLFGVPVNVQSLLPEDRSIGGFDTVSKGLETSAQHWIRYQQAADRAIDAALAPAPSKVGKTRMTGREYIEAHPKDRKRGLDVYKRLEGDALIFYAQANTHNGLELQMPRSLGPGRYKLRAMVESRNTGGRPVTVRFHWSGRRRDTALSHIAAVKDAPVDQAGVIEAEVTMPAGQGEAQVALLGWTLTTDEMLAHRLKTDTNAHLEELPALAIHWAEVEGPLHPFPSLGRTRMFGDLPSSGRDRAAAIITTTNAAADAERLMRAFLPVAFRRTVSPELSDYFVGFVHARLKEGVEFTDAMRAGYRAVITSPHFLFLVEASGRLDDYALAARLSYFLWKSMPDDELLRLAAQGRLSSPPALSRQVERMLNDGKAQRFINDFVDQWLDLRKTLAMKPDEIYGEYDDQLAWSLRPETVHFFSEVLARNLSVTCFVQSDWTFLNERLARHYGLYVTDGPKPVDPPFPSLPMSSSGIPPLALSPPPARPLVLGMDLRRVSLPPNSARGGILTHAAILKVTANGTSTSPVKRGAWVLDRIIGKPPSPPPPDVGSIEPDIRGATTIRQQLDKHRHTEACASCHRHIDPPGFALETFDVLGGWRDRYRVKEGGQESVALANYPAWKIHQAAAVEQGDVTPDGRPFKDIQEYRRILLEDPEQLARNLTQKLITYGTGAEIQFADREVIEKIVGEVKSGNYGLRSIVHAVVQSRCFLNK